MRSTKRSVLSESIETKGAFMTSKQFVRKTIIYSLILLFAIAVLVAVVDPFVHYHAPVGSLRLAESDERGQMVGIAKNAEYDTAIIGSSMSENFVPSWFNDGILGNQCVKMCMQGAHFDDYSKLLDEATARDTTKNIFFTLDNYLIMNVPEEYPTTIPEYLYNQSLTDEAYYLWNRSVLFFHLPKFLINNAIYDRAEDQAYVWQDRYQYGKRIALATYSPVRVITKMDEVQYDTFFQYADEFLEDMTAYIEKRPDIEFTFFAPPYSVLYWDDTYARGRLTAEICTLSRVYEKLLSYDNVKLFYFQDDMDVIMDLDNYKDYSHFRQEINRYMYESMRDGKHELTSDTYYDTLLAFYDWASTYYYDELFH